MDTIESYKAYANKIGNRQGLYKAIQEKYAIKSALYPGSHIDISPSLFISHVTYVDNFKGTLKFFKDMAAIEGFLEGHKNYKEGSEVAFFGQDYEQIALDRSYDLLISQYGGFVGQACKKFLKPGGYLLCNDSHGDASLAYFDDDYDFVGVVDCNFRVISKNKGQYFKLKSGKVADVDKVKATMKGPKYAYVKENYVFRLKTDL